MASSATTSLQIDEEKMGNSDRFYFGGFKITEDSDCSREMKRTHIRRLKDSVNK